MLHNYYTPANYFKNDFVGGTVASNNFKFLTGAPLPTKDYLTIIKPFEPYVWAFILASLVAVTMTLIFINKMHATWSNDQLRESAFQSNHVNKS